MLLTIAATNAQQSKNVLVFSKTAGYRHEAIPTGITAIKKLAKEHNFKVKATENAAIFNNDSLKTYDAVIFLNTTGTILDKNQKQAFKKFIQSGGGFVGIHAATDTEYDWEWYGKLVGAYFISHPKTQKATIKITNSKHLTMKDLPNPWQHFDEWYNFKNISPNITVLATLDESSYTGGKNGSFHPIVWCQKFDGGKMFYTGLGHTKEAYANPYFLKHLLGGIQYVTTKD